MPMRAPRICGCGKKVAGSQLCVCQQERRAKADAMRPSSSARGYTGKWSRESKAWLAQPGRELCACGCGRKANMVDHKVPPKGDAVLFWRRSNWQPMHSSCNSRKNIREEGGFGRKPLPGVVENFAINPSDRLGKFARDGAELEFSPPVAK